MSSFGQTLLMVLLVGFTLGDCFFLRWGAEPSQTAAAKSWGQSSPQLQPTRFYGYEQRKVYAPFAEAPGAPIPISVPLQASLTPVALQHVKLVPCMCPVAPEEADKLMEGPYLAQPVQAAQHPDAQALPKH